MPLFAAGAAAPDAVAKYSDKKSASFEGSIDPMTMLAVIRAQNESEEKIKSDLIDPIIDMTGSDKESFKRKRLIKEVRHFLRGVSYGIILYELVALSCQVLWLVSSAQKILKP